MINVLRMTTKYRIGVGQALDPVQVLGLALDQLRDQIQIPEKSTKRKNGKSGVTMMAKMTLTMKTWN